MCRVTRVGWRRVPQPAPFFRRVRWRGVLSLKRRACSRVFCRDVARHPRVRCPAVALRPARRTAHNGVACCSSAHTSNDHVIYRTRSGRLRGAVIGRRLPP
jgi:hypothetical protein